MATMKQKVTAARLAGVRDDDSEEEKFVKLFWSQVQFLEAIAGPRGEKGDPGPQGEPGPRGPAGPPGSGGGDHSGVIGVAVVNFGHVAADDPERVAAFDAEATALALKELKKREELENEGSPAPQAAA